MAKEVLSVREIRKEDIPSITDYWLSSDSAFMHGMGVDTSKIPEREQWNFMLNQQLFLDYKHKKSYCLIWEVDGKAIGHSNVNPVEFGQEAHMHLHLWNVDTRKKGMGAALVRLSLPWYFDRMELKKLYCTPYALNPAPNRTMQKVGFDFVIKQRCTPGSLNFEQEVNVWVLTCEKYQRLL